MAASKKKVVSKDDLRRLMRATNASRKSDITKTVHPHAKYNSLGQLLCTLCNTVLKSELLWTAHLQSKQHKEILTSVKSRVTVVDQAAGVKRKANDFSDSDVLKRFKDLNNGGRTTSGLPSDFFDKPGTKVSTGKQSGVPKPSKPSVLAEYSSSESDDDDDNNGNTQGRVPAIKGGHSQSKLPADFFDPGVASIPATSADSDPSSNKTSMAEVLPEGFFDDPVMDAKVRQVEYINKQEEEWELFQRAMKEEAHVSEAIVEEEDEQVNIDRNLDEIDDQMQRWKEVDDLQNKKEKIIEKGVSSKQIESDSDDSLDEADLEEFLDWRSKKS